MFLQRAARTQRKKNKKKKPSRMVKLTHVKTKRVLFVFTCRFRVLPFGTLAQNQCKVIEKQARRWWEPSLMQDGRHYMSHALRSCAPCHWNKCIQLVPLEVLTRSAEYKGLHCGLMYLLDSSWQIQSHTNITAKWYQKRSSVQCLHVCILGCICVLTAA